MPADPSEREAAHAAAPRRRRNRRFTVELERVGKTARREYVEWIQEAKRPETRTRRIAKTVELVREGKPQRGSEREAVSAASRRKHRNR